MSRRSFVGKKYESVTVSTTAVGITPSAGALWALARVEGADVRYRTDGTAPTATAGIRLKDGDVLEYVDSDVDYGPVLKSIKFIRQAATDATIYVEYYAET